MARRWIRTGAVSCLGVLLFGCPPEAPAPPAPDLERSKPPAEAEPFRAEGFPVHELEFTDPNEEFPPRLVGLGEPRAVAWEADPLLLTEDEAARTRQSVLADARVRDALGERFAFIDSGRIEPKKAEGGEPASERRVGLTFYSYSNNVAVDVVASDGKVQRVERKPGHQPPESEEEISAAVALARKDPRIAEHVSDLEGRAILTPSRPDAPSAGHRLLYVTFSERSGRLARAALVDLTAGEVLAAGEVAR